MAPAPVAAAGGRTDNIGSMLIFTLRMGAWFLFIGIRTGNMQEYETKRRGATAKAAVWVNGAE